MQILFILVANLVSIALVVAAAVLCFHKREGWGWFLFVAVLTFSGSSALRALDAPAAPATSAQPAGN